MNYEQLKLVLQEKLLPLFSETEKREAFNEAEIILEEVTSKSRSELIFLSKSEASREEETEAFDILKKRLSGEPIQYCIGKWYFFGEEYFVGRGVLIPRPETELLCEIAIGELKKSKKKSPVFLDLCSGSGCIGITVKNELPFAKGYLIEKSDDALFYLRKNAEKILGDSAVEIIKGDVFCEKNFESIFETEKIDLLISNPPYIKRGEISSLQKEVQLEPKMALDGGEDGFDFYKAICKNWTRFLSEKGVIAFECGENQSEAICSLFDKNKFDTEILKDYTGTERFVIGRSKNDF